MKIKANQNIKHNGVYYGPGASIPGHTIEAAHLDALIAIGAVTVDHDVQDSFEEQSVEMVEEVNESVPMIETPKRKRGRPPKNKAD